LKAAPAAARRTVAVDLTPVLPGGENGGAKLFAVELVRGLARAAPAMQLVLLTQAASHDELASLDADNVRRIRVVGAAATAVLHRWPDPLRRMAARAGYRVHGLMKRAGGRRALRALGVDLLFCPFTAPTFHEPGIPVVCTLHDLQFAAYPQFFAVEDAVLREEAFRAACRVATAIAAISEFSRGAALAQGAPDAGRVHVLPLRLAGTGRFVGTDPRAATGLGLTPRRYFLYPANYWKHKNHEMLLAGFGLARREGLPADIKLVCTGAPGARQSGLEEAARRMGLGDVAVFAGYRPRADLDALMAHSAGLVFPSLYEGFGLPLAEAMAAGVPVACSDRTALPEVAADAALLFDPRRPDALARALVALATDEALRTRLVAAGERRAREYTDADRMAREYLALFERALAASPA
jgi:glycosyltransferase involved in cell wall biosynthesis